MVSTERLKQICVPVSEGPAYHKRTLRVATIGAGFSGLIFAHKLQHEHKEMQDFIDHTIFEANDEVGGTWKVNTYPGVQCDVPAHIYAFPFDPNPNWSRFYASGSEIYEYIRRTATKWELRRDIQFNTRVVGLDWQKDQSMWKVRVQKIAKRKDQWDWPSIPGIHDFEGHKVHSASWDNTYDYSHKRIGIIGNGSSGIQILPEMVKLEGTTVVSFQRGPTYITPSIGETLDVKAGELGVNTEETSMENGNGHYSTEEIEDDDGEGDSTFNPRYPRQVRRLFATDKEKYRQYRKMLQQGMNKGYRFFKRGSIENTKAQEVSVERMRSILQNDEELCSKLIPTWEFGCRRVTPGEGYLESFLRPNVTLETNPIINITPSGIQTAAAFYTFDVIVCATGFDVSYIPRYPVTGRNNVTLASKWAEEPESYLSLACPDMPNYFIFTGPNATVSHGTLLPSISWTADYILRWLKKMASEDIKSVAPSQDATDEFVRYGDEIHKGLAWTGGCRSWYKNHRIGGRVTAAWPGSALLYREVMIAELRAEDWDIRYNSGNRWRGVLGNGFTELEEHAAKAAARGEQVDLAFYVQD
ncbi:hypothetical protein AYO20_08286 [Fonsecaea nubica]|uniref:FAD/NAD(P)-binding domain-containing protein n=1 Tax=Fonsecaea nubica TaxID=856822 RepID=A0A178CQQ1_9EURO|nr:hypothetical protein AYO20_08286 [Fonsecaea nubica]OAL31231.1 hypothetical protein AYO20_08286 [Fonsecaea nubica]